MVGFGGDEKKGKGGAVIEASGRCGFEPLSGISVIFLRTVDC
jgi:hypothetical protein